MNTDKMLESLAKSKFRSSFKLGKKYIDYIDKVGLVKVRSHAKDFIEKRLAVKPLNDGHQTPYKGHPVFIAQHATATCCRKCLNKWYKIAENKTLTEDEITSILNIIMKWIEKQYKSKV